MILLNVSIARNRDGSFQTDITFADGSRAMFVDEDVSSAVERLKEFAPQHLLSNSFHTAAPAEAYAPIYRRKR
jgi:hypothetical protein